MNTSSATLLERLRRALAPRLEVECELGAGAMGVVFLGHDPVLDRPVAIKVLRPEAATAVSAERFVREGRVLARLDHPNIVKVYQAGQADGLFYLVMDRVHGERLADRLRTGPLPVPVIRQLGRELLEALAVIHAAGMVHRDVKPANVLLEGGHVVLADFGIAKGDGGEGDLTIPGLAIGTPAYMPPEQAMGLPATPQSDLWSAGATLYEAATGRRYDRSDPEAWNGLSPDLAGALKRALEIDPARRWSAAMQFRGALAGARPRRGVVAISGVLVVAALAVAGDRWWRRGFPAAEDRPTSAEAESPTRRRLAIAPLIVGDGLPFGVGDSVGRLLTRRLSGYPDFDLVASEDRRRSGLGLEGRLTAADDGLRLDLSLREGGRTISSWSPTVTRAADWHALVDDASDRVALAMLTNRLEGDPWVPREALPHSPSALRRLLDGERHYASGRWQDALAAYLEAERADSTCLLCSYRLEDVARWLNWEPDRARVSRIRAAAARFPPHYRVLIEADSLPIAERLDALEAATRHYRDFDFVWYRYGEELFHRGPLAGRLQIESAEAFRATVRIRPDFAPAWNHLAWASIAAGDSVESGRALDAYERLERSSTGRPFAQLALLIAARAWRFGDDTVGRAITGQLLADPRIETEPLVAAAPRFLLAFQVWDGAIWLGSELARRRGAVELVRAGLLAQSLGHLGAGRPDSAFVMADRLAAAAPDAATQLFAAGLPAVLLLAERDSIDRNESVLPIDRLTRFLDRAAYRPGVTRAAAFLIAAVAIGSGQPAVEKSVTSLLTGDPQAAGYRAVLAGFAARRRGVASWSEEGLAADLAHILDEQPAARAVARFSTARWLARQNRAESAERTLRWVEHVDVVGVPAGAPLAAELEWALLPLARWQEAEILQRDRRDPARLCRLLSSVRASWRAGAPLYAERSREAEKRLAELACNPREP